MRTRLSLTLTLLSCASLSGASAVTPPVTPILQPGQAWVMQVGTPLPGWPAGGVVIPLGASRKVGAGSVKFTVPPRTDGAATVTDDLFYDPLDSDPEFIVGTRLTVRPGAAPVSVSCMVRTPHALVGRPQQGLLIRGDLFSREVVSSVLAYLQSGLQAGQPTCTLTRTR